MKSSARNTLIASTTVVALLGAYVTADVYDKVPGVDFPSAKQKIPFPQIEVVTGEAEIDVPW